MVKSFKKLVFFIASVVVFLNFVCVFNIGTKAESRYSGYGDASPYAATVSSETVNFTRREIEQIEVVNGVPMYTPINGLSNACGAVAGTIIVGFYDKYFEDLIPNYTSYISTGRYKSIDSTYIPKVMNEMYTLMRTNIDDVGVGQTDCINGLTQYVKDRNHSINMINIKANNKVDETLIRAAISNNNPSILFCAKTDVYNFSLSETYDTIYCTNMTTSGHIVVASGLYVVKYYSGNNLFRTDKYIKVATGLTNSTNTYLKLDSIDWCNGAYSVSIE